MDALGVPVARARVVDALNRGVAFTQYFGHSSYNVWSFSILFASPHAVQLQNAGRPSVVAQWGCWNTYYVHPTVIQTFLEGSLPQTLEEVVEASPDVDDRTGLRRLEAQVLCLLKGKNGGS